jgi:hypothetical protein
MSIWDNAEMQISSDYIKFENPGDTVTGTVTNIGIHRWDDGTVSPQITLDVDGETKTVTAGQVGLKALLAEKRPEVGETLTVTFTGIEKRAGGKTLKKWTVDVERADEVAEVEAKPAKKAAAKSEHTPEQIEAAKLLGIELD